MRGFSAAADGRGLSSARPAHKLRKQNSHSLGSRLSPDECCRRTFLYDSGTTVNLLTVLTPVCGTPSERPGSRSYAQISARGVPASSAKETTAPRLRSRDARGPPPRERHPVLSTHVSTESPRRKNANLNTSYTRAGEARMSNRAQAGCRGHYGNGFSQSKNVLRRGRYGLA